MGQVGNFVDHGRGVDRGLIEKDVGAIDQLGNALACNQIGRRESRIDQSGNARVAIRPRSATFRQAVRRDCGQLADILVNHRATVD